MKNLCLIIGCGKTGRSVYSFLITKGYIPIFYDDNDLCVNLHDFLNDLEFIVPSPGVNPNHEILIKAKQLNIPIISSTEIMYLFRSDKDNMVIGVTGTNGKTTVTSMINKLVKNSIACGNIGLPWTDVDKLEKINVVELSSFELDRTYKFKPNIFVLLNLAPDHIDYHGDYDSYINAKLKPLKNMQKDDILVYGAEDLLIAEKIKSCNCKRYYFSKSEREGRGIYLDKNIVVVDICGERVQLFNIEEINFVGHHNLLNILASVLVAYLCGESAIDIKNKLLDYKYEKYRLEEVKTQSSFRIFNDSKSTNLASTISALDVAERSIVLLVGGRGKKEDYAKLFNYMYKIKILVVFGESKDLFVKSAKDNGVMDKVLVFDNMRSAVGGAMKILEEGDVLLFSPACASFDEFSSYVERGDVFNELIKNALAY